MSCATAFPWVCFWKTVIIDTFMNQDFSDLKIVMDQKEHYHKDNQLKPELNRVLTIMLYKMGLLMRNKRKAKINEGNTKEKKKKKVSFTDLWK